MPASEETRVDIKLLHLLFGIAAIVMFFCTVWLLVVDHRREWKDYQRKFQAIQNWTLVSRDNEQQTENYINGERKLQAEVAKCVLELPPQDLVDQFVTQARSFGPGGSVDSQISALLPPTKHCRRQWEQPILRMTTTKNWWLNRRKWCRIERPSWTGWMSLSRPPNSSKRAMRPSGNSGEPI